MAEMSGPGWTAQDPSSGSWERTWGRVSSTTEASEFTRRRTLQAEGGSPGGTEPVLWTCMRRRGLSHVVTRGGGVSVTWSAIQSEPLGRHLSV